ncbi:DegV family protein [Domibacillus epiphyticus]|uniref:Fatty acid-binding protein DegV n=1 Tax=Domibacillus epiphyticus TaxID=1714355 RepID=A0A1V2A4A9_9BACI|nr:DegV family protein [Domibacillus epiphyticus]OMP65816.1 fatty acid-binding protein DegV [Domibacillus epiphyticus]
MKTAILTDSTAYLPKELRDELNIFMIPLSVIFGDDAYREEMDITTDEFYEKVRGSEKLPTTSQPVIGHFVEMYERIAKDYDAVIGIYLSSGISGTYQSSMTAADMVDGLNVYSFDTELSCAPQGFYVLRAAEMVKQGNTPEEIIAELAEMKQWTRAYFMVDDLNHLKRGGRLNGAQALIGGLLQVKPILHFEDKVIVPFEKIRTSKKALKRIGDLFEEVYNEGDKMQAVIIHANREDDARDWMIDLKKRFPNAEFGISHFGPVIGTHLGEGALAMGWTKKGTY